MFMDHKGKLWRNLVMKSEFRIFSLLYDISSHVNDLDTKVQGQQKSFSDIFRVVRIFK
jgi:hypothetical protein